MPIKSGFGFASSNKLLQKKWEERKYKAHQQKVRTINEYVVQAYCA